MRALLALEGCEDRTVPAAPAAGPAAFQQALLDLTSAQDQFTQSVSQQPGSSGTQQALSALVGAQGKLTGVLSQQAGSGSSAGAGSGSSAAPPLAEATALVDVQTQFVTLLAQLLGPAPTSPGQFQPEFDELAGAEKQLSQVLDAEQAQGLGADPAYQQALANLTADQGELVALLAGFSGSGGGSASGSGSGSGSTSGSGGGSSSGSGSGSGSSSSSGPSSTPPAKTVVHLDAVGAAAPGGPRVIVFNSDGSVRFDFFAYEPTFTGGVRVATADVTGDGTDDIITVSGPGRPTEVRVFDGVTGRQIQSFTPFEPTFTGGGYVAAGSLTGSGPADVVVAAGETGGPRVVAIRPSDGAVLASFFGISDPSFRGGARVAVEDLTGSGEGDVVVTPGAGGGPRVAVFGGRSVAADHPARMMADFLAMPPALRSGLSVGALDDGSGKPNLAFGGDSGGRPQVLVIGAGPLVSAGPAAALASPVAKFSPAGGARSEVRVAGVDPPGGQIDLVVSFGRSGPNRLQLFSPSDLAGTAPRPTATDFFDLDPSFVGGVYVS